jgi:sporulation protein YlmC with PRC-barrel domain
MKGRSGAFFRSMGALGLGGACQTLEEVPMRKQMAVAVSVLGLMAGVAFANDAKHVTQTGWVSINKLIGEDIYSPAGDKLGEVKDVVIAPAGKVQAVVDVNDSDRDIAVSMDKLTARPGHKGDLQMSATKDQLKGMAAFAYDKDAHWGARTVADARGGSTSIADRDADRTAAVAMPDRMSLEKMIGRTIVTADGNKIGDVEVVVLDKTGKARQVVIDLDWSTEDVAVDFNRLTADAEDHDRLLLAGVTKAQMDAMPKWHYDADTVSLKRSR